MKTCKIVKLGIILLFVVALQQLTAQQYPLKYMYDRYKFTINPAAIGIDKGVQIHANYAHNWNNALKGNNFAGLGIDAGFIYQNMGLGLLFSQELYGVMHHSNIQLQYAYRVILGDEHFLNFGIGAGMSYAGMKTSEIVTGNLADPLIGDSQFGFLGSFGINYRIKGFELDVSLPTYNTINYKNIPLFVAAGYLFTIKSDFGLKPMAMYRFLNPDEHIFDARLQFSYKDNFWVQAGYRINGEIVAGAGFGIKGLQMGVVCGINAGAFGSFNQANMELVLSYRFGNAKLDANKKRSAVNKRTEEALSNINKEVSDLKTQNQTQKEKLDEMNRSIAQFNEELKSEFKNSLQEINENITTLQKDELYVDESKVLDRQYFTVIFTTTDPDDADRIVNRLARQNVKSDIIRDTKRTHFYIYTQSFDNLQDAQAESKKLRSQGFSGAWILIVK